MELEANCVHAVLPCLPFTVDTFDAGTQTKLQFLTHAHKDHLGPLDASSGQRGIEVYGRRIVCSSGTRELLRIRAPKVTAEFIILDAGAHGVQIPTPHGTLTVDVLDAAHCHGAVMFIIKGAFGTVLHTGDCRLTPNVVQDLHTALTDVEVDLAYVDDTFGACDEDFPTEEAAIREVVAAVGEGLLQGRTCYLSADGLGHEPALTVLAEKFGPLCLPPPRRKVGAHPSYPCFVNERCHRERIRELNLLLPEGSIVSTREASCLAPHPASEVTLVGGHDLMAFRTTLPADALVVRLSAQRHAMLQPELRRGTGGTSSRGGLYADVLYLKWSCHSTKRELTDALTTLQSTLRAVLPIARSDVAACDAGKAGSFRIVDCTAAAPAAVAVAEARVRSACCSLQRDAAPPSRSVLGFDQQRRAPDSEAMDYPLQCCALETKETPPGDVLQRSSSPASTLSASASPDLAASSVQQQQQAMSPWLVSSSSPATTIDPAGRSGDLLAPEQRPPQKRVRLAAEIVDNEDGAVPISHLGAGAASETTHHGSGLSIWRTEIRQASLPLLRVVSMPSRDVVPFGPAWQQQQRHCLLPQERLPAPQQHDGLDQQQRRLWPHEQLTSQQHPAPQQHDGLDQQQRHLRQHEQLTSAQQRDHMQLQQQPISWPCAYLQQRQQQVNQPCLHISLPPSASLLCSGPLSSATRCASAPLQPPDGSGSSVNPARSQTQGNAGAHHHLSASSPLAGSQIVEAQGGAASLAVEAPCCAAPLSVESQCCPAPPTLESQCGAALATQLAVGCAGVQHQVPVTISTPHVLPGSQDPHGKAARTLLMTPLPSLLLQQPPTLLAQPDLLQQPQTLLLQPDLPQQPPSPLQPQSHRLPSSSPSSSSHSRPSHASAAARVRSGIVLHAAEARQPSNAFSVAAGDRQRSTSDPSVQASPRCAASCSVQATLPAEEARCMQSGHRHQQHGGPLSELTNRTTAAAAAGSQAAPAAEYSHDIKAHSTPPPPPSSDDAKENAMAAVAGHDDRAKMNCMDVATSPTLAVGLKASSQRKLQDMLAASAAAAAECYSQRSAVEGGTHQYISMASIMLAEDIWD